MSPCKTQAIDSKKVLIPTLFDVPEPTKKPSLFIVQKPLKRTINDYQPDIEKALKTIFPDRQDESRLQKSRRILGDIALDIPDDDLERTVTDFQYLVDTWLDEYEKQVFDNKTLNQILKEGNYGSASK